MVELTIISWNAGTCRDHSDAVLSHLKSLDAQCVAITGGPLLWRWKSRSARLAQQLGMVVVTGGGPAAGSLLLSTLAVDVDAAQSWFLPRKLGHKFSGVAQAACRYRKTRFMIYVSDGDFCASDHRIPPPAIDIPYISIVGDESQQYGRRVDVHSTVEISAIEAIAGSDCPRCASAVPLLITCCVPGE